MSQAHHLSGEQASEASQFATLQAIAAQAGAELTQTKAGTFIVRRGNHSTHCQEIEGAAQILKRITPARKATP